MNRDCFLNLLGSFGVSKDKKLVLGVMVTSSMSANNENDDFSGFPKVKSESY